MLEDHYSPVNLTKGHLGLEGKKKFYVNLTGSPSGPHLLKVGVVLAMVGEDLVECRLKGLFYRIVDEIGD